MATRRKDFCRMMSSVKSSIYASKNKKAAEYWLRVKKLISDSNFSSYKNAKSLVDFTLSGYNDEAISVKLNVSVTTVRVHRMNLSNELYDIFGDDFFSLFEDDFSANEETLEHRYDMAYMTINGSKDFLEDLLPIDIFYMLTQSVNSVDSDEPLFQYDFKDCINELNFLERHSIETTRMELSSLNKDKLRYLMGISKGAIGTPDDKYTIFKTMSKVNSQEVQNA